MTLYKIQFVGRRIGAIGITYVHTVTVEAETQEQAISKLYETYDHISAIIFLKEQLI